MDNTLAVIVGIAEYATPRLRLRTPVRDAEALATLLAEHHGYDVRLYRDGQATLRGLGSLFEDELPRIVSDSHRVLVYFAGHGMAVDEIDNPRGYLIPVDGSDAIESLFPMERLNRALDALKCHHLLLILDCCFAGAFRWSAGRDVVVSHVPVMYRERYERFLATPAWQVITSAAYDEKAADIVAGMVIGQRARISSLGHSPFFEALRDGLEGEADLLPRTTTGGNDGVITATELYLYLRDRLEVANGGPRQTPSLWSLPKHHKGEYIFHVPGRDLQLVSAGPLSQETSPYRGLAVYEAEHTEMFHGRRTAIAALLAQVEQQPITCVVGHSGTGKSSLVRAGLIPALRRSHPDWHILGPLLPGKTPVTSLDALVAEQRDGVQLLVIDQLEELFTMHERDDDRTQFLERILTLVGTGTVRVVATLRTDLETKLWDSPFGKFWPHARFLLTYMTREELREAIEKPAEAMALTFDPPEMVDRLIDAVVSMPGALFLLSFALDKLYLDCIGRANGDRRLVEADPLDPGGIALALRNHADVIYERFDAAHQQTLRRLMLRMVAIKDGNATRRQLPIEELEFDAPDENLRVHAVLNTLTGGVSPADEASIALTPVNLRIAVLGGDRSTSRFIELAHDAVALDWHRMKAWCTVAHDDLALRHAITIVTFEWVQSGRRASLLWDKDPRLPLARRRLTSKITLNNDERNSAAALHSLNRLEAEFLARGHRARVRRRTFFWSIPIILGSFLYLRVQSEQAATERAEVNALVELGSRIIAQASVPGKEQDALTDAIEALRRAMRTGRPVPATVFRGATEAATYHHIEISSEAAKILSLACSYDGSKVTMSRVDGSVVLYSHGAAVKLVERSSIAMATLFMPDATAIIAGSQDGYITSWSLAAVRESHVIARQQDEIEAIAISPDGQSLVTGGKDGRVRLWMLANRGTAPVIFEGFSDIVTDVAISHDGDRIAAGSRDGTSRVWSIRDQRLVFDSKPQTTSNFTLSVTSVDFSADGSFLITGGMQTTVWDLSSGSKLTTLQDIHAISARFSPDGRELITGGWDGTVLRWDARSLRRIDIAIRQDRPVSIMKYCGAYDRIAVADDSGRSYIRDLSRDNASAVFGSRKDPITAVAFARDDRTVFTGSRELERWDTQSGERVASGLSNQADLWSLVLSSDGSILQAETRDGDTLAWDTARNVAVTLSKSTDFDMGRIVAAVVAERRQPATNVYLGMSIDDRFAGLIGKYERKLRTANKALEQHTSPAGVASTSSPSNAVSFSPRGDLVAATGLDGAVEILDAATGQRMMYLLGHVGAARSVMFSPDGTNIVTTGDDGTARLWDVATGATLAVFTGHTGAVLSAAFSHDGERIATAGIDGTVRIYPVRAAGILRLACSRLRDTPAWSRVSATCSAN